MSLQLKNFYKENKIIITTLIISFTFRILFSLDNNKSLFLDIKSYEDFALIILKSGIFAVSAYHPPLYLFFIAGICKFLGYGFIKVYILQSVLGTGITLFIYLTAKKVFNKKAGEISAVLSLLYWPLTLYSGVLMSEALFLFLLMSGVYCFIKGTDSHKGIYFILMGFLLALSTLTRSINLILIILIPAAYIVLFKTSRKTAAINITAYVLAFCIVLTPWIARNYLLYKTFIPIDTLSGINLYIGNNENANGIFMDISGSKDFDPGKNDLENDRALKKAAVKCILKHPFNFIFLTLRRVILFIIYDFMGFDWVLAIYMDHNFIFKYFIWKILFYISDIIFFSTGVMGLKYLIVRKKGLVLLGFIFYYFCLTSLFYIQARYRLPVMPFLAVSGAAFVQNTYKNKNKVVFKG